MRASVGGGGAMHYQKRERYIPSDLLHHFLTLTYPSLTLKTHAHYCTIVELMY